jgi:NitT/TauT family transport system substrate-binding protein
VPISRTRLYTTIALGAAVLTVSACGGSSSSAKPSGAPEQTVSIASTDAGVSTLPIQLIKSENLLGKQGVDMKFLQLGNNSSTIVAAVERGSAEVGFAAGVSVPSAIQHGAGLQVIANAGYIQLELVLRPSVIKRLNLPANASLAAKYRALEGLKIATNPVGSGVYDVLQAVLASQHVTPSKVHIIGVADHSSIVAGLEHGTFDGAFLTPGTLEQNVADGSAQYFLNSTTGGFPLINKVVSVVAIVKTSTAQKDPALMQKIYTAVGQANNLINTQPGPTGVILKKDWFAQMSPAVWASVWAEARQGFPTTAAVTPAQWATLNALGGLKKPLNYDSYVLKLARG